MPPISKTCLSCANSKVRCIRTPENPHVCTRCLRLGRECAYRQSGRRFNGFQKDRKIEALEARVKELMADRIPSETLAAASSSTRSASVAASDDEDKDIIDRGFLSLQAADRYLKAFKTIMTPHFPFVVVAPSISAAQLRQHNPFLFLAIIASSSSHYHTKPHRYTQFLQLAISLIIELRLDRPPNTQTWKTKMKFAPQDTLDDNLTCSRPSWGSAERRAVVGCYYLSSSIAVLLQKHSTFHHTPYIDECCQFLHDTNEHPHDQYITPLVQLQHIAEKIDRLSTSHRQEMMAHGSGAELYVSNIKAELDSLQNGLPLNIVDIPLVAIHFHATRLCLFQLALNFPGQEMDSELGSTQYWRNEMSCAAINAAESILALYIFLPTNSELSFTNTQWVQLAFAMLIAYRHTAMVSKPEQTAAFCHTLEKIQQRVNALSTPYMDRNGDRDVFFYFRKRVDQIQGQVNGARKREGPSGESREIGSPGNIPNTFESGPDNVTTLSSLDDIVLPIDETYDFLQDFLFDASIEQIMGNWV
ncbi:hypothetical protein N7462_005762 [Penicillium macrosclerotiorum]|uniref:uncharacterized protein n=1 Tax=Penicillium macrosclerotiorum TaxID=303699 RepID=UPI002547C3BC|nr:uncharacterized protein N7462_005762 [Penicillium macrosclerotiorum]KAJ5682597.1 hypothetical protein N7462_005762 [Penicillium macrosclerotiorum]